MTTTLNQANDALNETLTLVNADALPHIMLISEILPSVTYSHGGVTLGFEGKHKQHVKKIELLTTELEKLKMSLHRSDPLGAAEDFHNKQPLIHKKVLAQLMIMIHKRKKAAAESDLAIITGVKDNLDALANAVDVGGSGVNALKTALALPAATIGIFETPFKIAAAEAQRKVTVSELLENGIDLEGQNKDLVKNTIDSLDTGSRDQDSLAASIKRKLASLDGHLRAIEALIKSDITSLETVKKTHPSIPPKIQELKALHSKVTSYNKNFRKLRKLLTAKGNLNGLLNRVKLEREKRGKKIATSIKEKSTALQKTLIAFQMYMDKKIHSAHEATGYKEAFKGERLGNSELRRTEQAILKVELLRQIRKLEDALDLDEDFLDKKNKHNTGRMMKKLVAVDHDVSKAFTQLKVHHKVKGDTASIFLYSVIHAIRDHSRHHLADDPAYMGMVTQLLGLVYRAFKGDRTHKISRKDYETSVEAATKLADDDTLKKLIKKDTSSTVSKSIFKEFNQALEKSKALLNVA